MKVKHFFLIFLLSFACLFQTSCSSSKVIAKAKTHKKGWTKNPKNPHHQDHKKHESKEKGHDKHKSHDHDKKKGKGHDKKKD